MKNNNALINLEIPMRKQVILIDLDNTVIDTAIRKHAILKDFLPQQTISEQKVREDFDLVTVLGPDDTDASTSFFEMLDSEKGILNYQAPIFPGVINFFKKYKETGISIVLITGRPNSLRNATIEEIKKANVDNYISELYMRGSNHSSVKDFKISQIKAILQKYDVIVFIGDRLDDLEAAKYHNLPFILIRTTLPSQTVLDSKNLQISGGAICMTWSEIDAATDTIIEGRKELSILREKFTDSYANWLSDLDNKCRITATISGILATISGKITIDKFYPMAIINYILLVVFGLSVLSLLYSIRSMTSRRTSGPSSGIAILANIKQWFAILFGRPSSWQYKSDDAIASYKKLLKSSDEIKAKAHYDFFIEQFETYDPESLSNIRLFQLRAANYSKVYAETIASRLLQIAILLILIWLILSIWFVSPASPAVTW